MKYKKYWCNDVILIRKTPIYAYQACSVPRITVGNTFSRLIVSPAEMRLLEGSGTLYSFIFKRGKRDQEEISPAPGRESNPRPLQFFLFQRRLQYFSVTTTALIFFVKLGIDFSQHEHFLLSLFVTLLPNDVKSISVGVWPFWPSRPLSVFISPVYTLTRFHSSHPTHPPTIAARPRLRPLLYLIYFVCWFFSSLSFGFSDPGSVLLNLRACKMHKIYYYGTVRHNDGFFVQMVSN